MARSAVSVPFEADREVPALIVKFGDYPLHHGGVGAIRSLGRLGVPVYAITEDRYTPAAASRYLQRAFVWPTSGAEDPGRLVEGLLRIGRRIGRPTVLVPTACVVVVLVAKLGGGYVSSVPGLYVTGLPAAASYGPVMRFVCGTEFASPRLAKHLAAAHG